MKEVIIMVYGIGETKEKVKKTKLFIELEKYYNIYIIEYLSGPINAYGDIREYARILDEGIIKIKHENNVDKVNIVAHSMGGLISRYRIQKINEDDVKKLIMIGTPNHGTDLSNNLLYSLFQFGINPLKILLLIFNRKYQKNNPNQAINEMLPRSDFLFELNENDKTGLENGQCNIIDKISKKVKYFVISGNKLATFCLGKGKFVKGDGIVPFNSAKLSNAKIFPISAHHGGEYNNKEVINIVKKILEVT